MIPSHKQNIDKGDAALIKELTQKDFAERAPALPPHLLHIHYLMVKNKENIKSYFKRKFFSKRKNKGKQRQYGSLRQAKLTKVLIFLFMRVYIIIFINQIFR